MQRVLSVCPTSNIQNVLCQHLQYQKTSLIFTAFLTHVKDTHPASHFQSITSPALQSVLKISGAKQPLAIK